MFHRGDHVVTETATLDEDLLVESEARHRPWVEFLASTPGRLTVLGIVLIAVVIAAGAITSAAVGARQQRVETLRTHTEPLANAAQALYSSLSIADAAATTSFVSGNGANSAAGAEQFTQAVGDASNALVTATNGVSSQDADSLALLSDVVRNLAEYFNLVATAQANDRSGNPVGVAYLSDASALMQNTILPLAERLYVHQAEAVAETQTHTAQLPATAFTVTAAALVVLVLSQLYLVRKSKRRFNPGLAVASLLMAGLLLWLIVASLVSTSASEHARTEGTQPIDMIARARILAQQARADETLAIVQRGSDTQSEIDYVQHSQALSDELTRQRDSAHGRDAAAHIGDAGTAFDGWRAAHRDIEIALERGDYPTAESIAAGSGTGTSAAQFAALDEALRNAIDQLRADEADAVSNVYRSMSALAIGSMVIGVSCGFAVGGGIWPRLNEYH
ncbi:MULTISPECIES: hypothetical protein [unclassified Rhodococcus (in: high G+C Gram-positive bacteria)]|uniref:hypothetical protein n=1 Tax=unclassified Rhodococcus (in: high G+C Gram-positive bacteria) TaxID=192944 RepID=UPI00163AC98E|nr:MULTISPECIES: hypothetical protein [unclassified Rhodococcus (in: high G+C Gram-positive bacteria)]MBC2640364.1 hypothetical protein [Rhodococcus sp. 3A]MBC2894890.1 hypothetical protein [Rhodococcus sp. 4CII]